MLRSGLVVVALTLLLAAPARAQDRYAYAGGCYAVAGVAGAEQVRLQATALGRYLLYRPDGTYVTPTRHETLGGATLYVADFGSSTQGFGYTAKDYAGRVLESAIT